MGMVAPFHRCGQGFHGECVADIGQSHTDCGRGRRRQDGDGVGSVSRPGWHACSGWEIECEGGLRRIRLVGIVVVEVDVERTMLTLAVAGATL